MKLFLIFAIVVVATVGGLFFINRQAATEPVANQIQTKEITMPNVSIQPIEHASGIIMWDENVIFTDPVGDAILYSNYPQPDLVLLTDIHGDHLSAETLKAIIGDSTPVVAPQAVADELPQSIADRTVVLANDEETQMLGFHITAIPMYNIPESEDSFHTKGRGNGYVIVKDDFRVYVAGDTSGTPEMRSLNDIDIALIPMNLPFTMDVDEAASAILEFAPKKVYPYHYRGREGLSDVAKFKTLVDAGNKDIEVVLLDWYPNQ